MFIVESLAEAVDAVNRAVDLDRRGIRHYVAHNFSQERMVDEYIRVYQAVLEQHRARRLESSTLKGRKNNEG